MTVDVRQVIRLSGLAQLVQANARFTRADIPGQNTLLVTAYVQSDADGAKVKARLSHTIKQRLTAQYNAVPPVDITVLER